MRQRFAAGREILSFDLANHDMLCRIRSCGNPYPCLTKYCPKCYESPIENDGWRVDHRKFIAEEVVNPVRYHGNVKPGTHRHIKNAMSALEPFYGAPVDEVAPITIKYAVLQGGEDYLAVLDFYRQHMKFTVDAMRRCIHPDAMLVHRFEWSWTTAGQVRQNLPLRAPGIVDARDMDPDQVVALFHSHGFAHVPGQNRFDTGNLIRLMFDGCWQVHVGNPRKDTLTGPTEIVRLLKIEHPQKSHLDPFDGYSRETNDHPREALDCDEPYWEFIRQKDTFKIDARLDALDPDPDGNFDQWGLDIDARKERTPGIIGYATYMGKEYLPQAYSRHTKRSTDTNPSDYFLTPEQMVIALHGDAELKLAFHGKRMVQHCGTCARKKKVAMNNAGTSKPTSNSSPAIGDTKIVDHSLKPNGDITFEGSSIRGCETAITRKPVSTTAELSKTSLPHETASMFFVRHPYNYKANPECNLERPLFLWLGSQRKSTLSLGIPVPKPP